MTTFVKDTNSPLYHMGLVVRAMTLPKNFQLDGQLLKYVQQGPNSARNLVRTCQTPSALGGKTGYRLKKLLHFIPSIFNKDLNNLAFYAEPIPKKADGAQLVHIEVLLTPRAEMTLLQFHIPPKGGTQTSRQRRDSNPGLNSQNSSPFFYRSNGSGAPQETDPRRLQNSPSNNSSFANVFSFMQVLILVDLHITQAFELPSSIQLGWY